MPSRAIPYVKALVHLLCLYPIVMLGRRFVSGQMAADADPINSITHFTGNWALWILLISLAVTPIRRLHPRLSNLIRFRRLLGLYAFFYATLHLATYVFLFSGYDIAGVWSAIRAGHPAAFFQQFRVIWPTMLDDAEKRRFIQIGLAAWLVLLALAVTSPLFMLRALGGKRWQRLHRLVYVAATAACIHFWWLVKAGVRTPMTTTLVLAVLFAARLVWVIAKGKRPARAA
jgi:sulfoxide reductase heme-binding subunit YedZ